MDSNSVSPEQNAAKIYCPVFLGISLGSMVTLGREANLTRFFLPVGTIPYNLTLYSGRQLQSMLRDLLYYNGMQTPASTEYIMQRGC